MLRKIVTLILPKFLTNGFPSKYGYKGVYKSWAEAQKASGGYNQDNIITKTIGSLAKVRDGLAAFERDTVLYYKYDKIKYSWHVLTWLLYAAIKKNNELNIIDLGGSLGTSFYQYRKYLNGLNKFKWNIIEQEKIVDEGKKSFSNPSLSFYYSVEEALRENDVNIVMLSGTLQYIEDPYQLLNHILQYKFDYLLFDLHPVFKDDLTNDTICIQKVPPYIFQATIPVMIFNKNHFLSCFHDYQIVGEIVYPNGLKKDVEYVGYLFEKTEK